MASAAAWAAGMVLTRRLAADDSTVTTQAYSAAVGLGVLTLALPLDGVLPGATELAWLAIMALCWTGAQWLVVAAYGRHPPPSVAPYANSQLVWATLLGTAFSQQWPTTGHPVRCGDHHRGRSGCRESDEPAAVGLVGEWAVCDGS